jgi:thioredoxin 1
MYEENELEQIRLRKIQTMLDAAKKSQTSVEKQPIILTDSNFQAAVKANELLVVDFWAPWCGPCRMVGPIIEALSAEYTGKAAFGKMNVDENQVVPSSFGIISIPTIVIFNHGKEVERLVGAYPKAHIETMIKRYLGLAVTEDST